MIRCFSRKAPFRPRTIASISVALASVMTAFVAGSAAAYSLTGKSWPSGTQLVFQLNLGNPLLPLSDGNTSWNAAVSPALGMWNQKMQRLQMNGVNSTAGAASGDRVNSVVFSTSVYGQSFGTGTLAVTYYMMQGSTLVEADILFNKAMVFDSYRGDLKFPVGGGTAIADIRRVFLHEVGHGIGLNHPSGVDAVMNAMISNREVLSNDDIAGIQQIYGAPAATPTPAPTPTPTPTPAPTVAPTNPPSHLANISTRMKVGLGEDVLIGGFIISGAESKKLILRAIGPSLGTAGVAGAMSDPILELFDSRGNRIAENDDWQNGTQAQEIIATGVAPTAETESALIVTLPAGSYTAVLSGWDNAQGIALVEAYELDATFSRLLNLSTRGRIGTGEQTLIGGIIVRGSLPKRMIVRAVGPSLSIAGSLDNPQLELRDSSGNLVGTNDNWGDSPQRAEIIATGVAPTSSLESALVATLAPGSYTAMVRGVNNTTGVGLVEMYDLDK